MKGLKFKMLTLVLLLVSVFAFSQNLQPKPISYENQDGVFITVDLMDSITLKLIDRNVLKSENATLVQTLNNVKSQNQEMAIKYEVLNSQALSFKELYDSTEIQKTLLYESLENQKLITKNVKKNRLETVLYILEVDFPSDLPHLHC